MKALIASIIAFFTSLFSPTPTLPAPSPTPTVMATPLPTPAYPRATYTNNVMNYQFFYPADTEIVDSDDYQTSWDKKYTLRITPYVIGTPSLETLLDTDLNCIADGPVQSISCNNTAVKPFTNQSNTSGYLIRRTKIITGIEAGEYKDTAYVFPINAPAASAVIISVSDPTPDNLAILADTANWFTALP